MKICFHHVGENGAKEDFPKTIYRTISIENIQKNIPDSIVEKEEIIRRLREKFQNGKINCWGVPSGAKSVIKKLEEGDLVFLVEKASEYGGSIPVLAKVKVYFEVQLWDLSKALWGSNGFPYIFFFETQKIDLDWLKFADSLEYKRNFRPSGNFYIIKNERIDKYGDINSYLKHLNIVENKENEQNLVKEESTIYVNTQKEKIEVELKNIEIFQEKIKDFDKIEREQMLKIRIGQSLFRDNLLRKYKKCIVCGINQSELLVASHIKPWSKSEKDEKLDTENGLLLCPHHDSLFDKGFISFSEMGKIIISNNLNLENYKLLNLDKDIRIELSERNIKYMKWHFENKLKK